MKNKEIKCANEKEGFMVALTKKNERLPLIAANKSKEFIEISNKNRLTKEYLEVCNKSSEIFKMNINKR